MAIRCKIDVNIPLAHDEDRMTFLPLLRRISMCWDVVF